MRTQGLLASIVSLMFVFGLHLTSAPDAKSQEPGTTPQIYGPKVKDQSQPFQLHAEQQDEQSFDSRGREKTPNGGSAAEFQRPPWLPGSAWTTKDLRFWSGELHTRTGPTPRKLDEHSKWRMDQRLLGYWPGRRPNPCNIRFKVDPSGPPGNFTFKSSKAGGPCGWCVFLGHDVSGFPIYQYWFDMSRIDQ